MHCLGPLIQDDPYRAVQAPRCDSLRSKSSSGSRMSGCEEGAAKVAPTSQARCTLLNPRCSDECDRLKWNMITQHGFSLHHTLNIAWSDKAVTTLNLMHDEGIFDA